jgi:hypothetical protein
MTGRIDGKSFTTTTSFTICNDFTLRISLEERIRCERRPKDRVKTGLLYG